MVFIIGFLSWFRVARPIMFGIGINTVYTIVDHCDFAETRESKLFQSCQDLAPRPPEFALDSIKIRTHT